MKYTDDASEKTKEECCPGQPYMSFEVAPGVAVKFTNPQRFNGQFTTSLKVYDGTTLPEIIERLSRENKIKGNNQ